MNLLELVNHIGFEVDEKPLEGVEDRLEKIQHRLEFLGAAEVVKGIFEMAEKFSGFAAQLNNTAIATGLSVERLQGLQFAAAQSGSSAEELGGAMSHLTRQLYAARQGSAEALQAFAAVGITPAQVQSFKTGSDALGALADHVKGISDPVERQAQAMKLLGPAAAGMVGLLSQGSEGIAGLSAEASKSGAILSSRYVHVLQEVEDGLSGVWQVVKVFSATIASYFAPSILQAVKVFHEWYDAHQALLKTTLKRWAEEFMYALGYVVGVITTVIDRMLAFAGAHKEILIQVTKVVAALMAVAVAVNVVQKVIGFLQAGMALIGLVLSPLGLITAGIAALVLVLQAAYTMLFKGGSFKDTWLGQLYEGAKGIGRGILEKLGVLSPEGAGAAGEARPDDAALKGIGLGAGALPSAYQGMEAIKSLGSTPAVAAQASAAARAAPVAGGDFNLSAPITINVPSGTDGQDVARKVKEGVVEHLDRVTRAARRSVRTPMAY